MTSKAYLFLLLIFAHSSLFAASSLLSGGRVIDDDRDVRFQIKLGSVTDISGMVEETTRKLYYVTGNVYKQAYAETYDLNDFGMNEAYPSIGLDFESDGKWFSFVFDTLVMSPSVDTVARRNYYIGIGEAVEYNGASYTSMKIPSGTPFSMDMMAVQTDIGFYFTPFTVSPADFFSVTPWVGAGLMLFTGYYDLDAGDPQGVTQYQNPPVDFVIGGKSSGLLAVGLPELSLGGELRFGNPAGHQVVLQGNFAQFSYSGSTAFLTSSKHREKNADIDHVHYMARLKFETPLKSGSAISFGVSWKSIETEGMITATADTPEEILATQERFDKHIKFAMNAVFFEAGMTF